VENLFTNQYPGRCVSCGFLGRKKVGSLSEPPLEVSAVQRLGGTLRPDNIPWCFVRKEDLWADYSKIFTDITNAQGKIDGRWEMALARMFKLPRGENGCDRWHEWVEGFDPRWHYEDWRMTEFEKLRLQQSTALKEITDELAKIAKRSEDADAKFQGTDTLFKWAFGFLAFLTLLVGSLPVYDRLTGHELPVNVAISTPSPNATPIQTTPP
jgi:hypothetical protein